MPIAKKKPKPRTNYRVFASYRSRQHRHSRRELVINSSQGRTATRQANRVAKLRRWRLEAMRYPRQVSVYMIPPGQRRGKLIHQVHWNAKLRRLVAEEL